MKLRFPVPALVVALAALLAGGLGAQSRSPGPNEILFVQLSDTHWGFNNPAINPDYAGTLKKAIAQVNALPGTPDFIVFSGDETHTTDDPAVRRQRMTEFKSIISSLNVKEIKFLPGEHDASLDNAQAYREFFGEPYYSFDDKGVHFIALDNVSSGSSLGEAQLAWLQKTLAGFQKGSQVILFSHRPLLDVYPQWDWRTKDGTRALDLLKPFGNVNLFYGHIHQLRTDSNDWFTQYAARGLMFPLPAPGSAPKSAPVAWDPQNPYRGLGFRTVEVNTVTHEVTVTEYPLAASQTSDAGSSAGSTIKVVARRGEFSPDVIRLKKNVPATLEITSTDVRHGFAIPDLNIETSVVPNQPTRVALTPDKAGEFNFLCTVFCGEGHEDMTGRIIVE